MVLPGSVIRRPDRLSCDGTRHATQFTWGLVLFFCSGCVVLPDGHEKREAAIGRITVSSLLFTPLETPAAGGKRLEFGALRNEQKLAEKVEKPSVGLSLLRYTALETALKAAYAGPQVTTTETRAEHLQADAILRERKKEEERTFKSPAVPSQEVKAPETPDEIRTALVRLLEKSDRSYGLPADDIATLVAAYKTYMVNLEEYYNVEGFGYDSGITADYIPYKVHFTVSAEPGWYTRYYSHDAVVELTLGGCRHANEFRILTVAPAETAQTIDQLTAALDKLSAALSLQGTFQAIAGQVDVNYIREIAQRLEGMRTNKTLTVSFPKANAVRIRFRPTLTPTEAGGDLQPTSRIMTAIVLVKNMVRDDGVATALAMTSASTSEEILASASAQVSSKAAKKVLEKLRYIPTDRLYKELETNRQLLLAQPPPRQSPPQSQKDELHNGAKKALEIQPPIGQAGADDEAKAAEEIEQVQSTVTKQLDRQFEPRERCMQQRWYFEPALTENAEGSFSPRWWILWWSRNVERLDDDTILVSKFQIPPWLGPLRRDLSITKAFGYYSADYSEVIPARCYVDAAKRALDELKSKKSPAGGAGGGTPPPSDTSIRDAEQAFEVERRKLAEAWGKASKNARAVVGYTIESPETVVERKLRPDVDDGVRYDARDCAVFVRVVAPGGPLGPSEGWTDEPVGRGMFSATRAFAMLDLSLVLPMTTVESEALPNVRVLLEAALTLDKKAPSNVNVRSRVVLEVVLEPMGKTSVYGAASDGASTITKIGVDVGNIELNLKGAVPDPQKTTEAPKQP